MRSTVVLLLGLVPATCGVACGSPTSSGTYGVSSADPPPASAPTDGGHAPTYTELFTKFFARGTPGHCATAECHDDPGHNQWLCGATKDDCYAGMVEVGLIDPDHPEESMIADPTLSPLTWINLAGGNMPFDAQGENPAGRDAITAWVAAGAQND